MRKHRVIAPFLIIASMSAVPAASMAQGARLKLDNWGDLASRAKEVVNITIDKETMGWASQGFSSKGGDAAELRDLMKELEGVYVQVIEFDKDGAPSWEELIEVTSSVRQQLDGPQWTPIVSVTEKKKRGQTEMVRISLFKNASGEPGGLAIFVLEPDEVVLVNLVGRVRLDQLGRIGKALGKQGKFKLGDDTGSKGKQKSEKKAE
ncbi:MAG: DUF4252 domain-containing protein [Vicinamibacteria bacterium]|nr:DUF4252 domain-containing protein [Vicinamibacteria bacterium]